MKGYYTNILIFLIIFSLISCGSKKKILIGVDCPNALSQKFGIRVITEDNLSLYSEASKWLGIAHRYGGNTQKGIDCSGFVVQIYLKVYGKQLYRSSANILKYNCKKIQRNNLKEGDLVFFRTDGGRGGIPNHVGIYLKNNKFVHTSISKGVTVSSLSEPYYIRTWITGGRVN
jgi:lipoprotein Spr